MATISTVPAVLAALYSAFCNDVALKAADVQVAESWPGGDFVERQCLFLGDVTADGITVPTMRAVRVSRDEQYAVDVHAQVAVADSTATPARVAAFAIYAEVENILVSNPTLGVDGVIKALPRAFTLVTSINDAGGWNAFLRIVVAVEARLT